VTLKILPKRQDKINFKEEEKREINK